MATPPPYEFTWGVSSWADGSVWAQPGTYTTSLTSSSASSALFVPLVVIDTGFVSESVTDAEYTLTGGGQYVDPTGTSGVYVSPFTDRLYGSFPAMYRNDDAQQVPAAAPPNEFASGQAYDTGFSYDQTAVYSSNYPFLRWLASLCDFSAGQIDTLVAQFNDPVHSALTDPQLAEPDWLPWLAQFVGIQIPTPIPDVTVARQQIAGAMTSAPAGSKQAMVACVQQVLTGAKSVEVRDHYLGQQWVIEVNTFDDQTPTVATGNPIIWGPSTWGGTAVWQPADPIVEALETAGQKPAGFELVHTISYGFTWGVDEFGGSHVWEAQPEPAA